MAETLTRETAKRKLDALGMGLGRLAVLVDELKENLKVLEEKEINEK